MSNTLREQRVPTPISTTKSTIADHTIVAGVAGKQIVIDDLVIIVPAGKTAQTINVKAGATVIYGPVPIVVGDYLSISKPGGRRLPAGSALVVSLSAADDVVITGGYFVE